MYRKAHFFKRISILLVAFLVVLIFLNSSAASFAVYAHGDTGSGAVFDSAATVQMPKNAYQYYHAKANRLAVRQKEAEPAPARSAVIEGVQPLNQLPELPTGCETTALTMALNFAGYDVDKMTLAERYLPKAEMGEGTNPYTTFIGDPKSESGFGCYAPALMMCVAQYGARAKNLSGCDFHTILSYIGKGQPVIVWATMFMVPTGQGEYTYIRPDGVTESWKNNEHCLLMTGYDLDKNIVLLADPLTGSVVEYDLSVFLTRWEEQGKQAMIVFKKNIRK